VRGRGNCRNTITIFAHGPNRLELVINLFDAVDQAPNFPECFTGCRVLSWFDKLDRYPGASSAILDDQSKFLQAQRMASILDIGKYEKTLLLTRLQFEIFVQFIIILCV